MTDTFLMLTPFLILAVVLLLGFTGCYTRPTSPGPQLLSAVPDDKSALLTWDPVIVGYWSSYTLKRSTTQGGPYTDIAHPAAADTSYTDTGLTDGTTYFYVISGHLDDDGGEFGGSADTADSNELAVTPMMPITVTFDNPPPPGNPLNDLDGVYKNLDFGNAAWIWLDPGTGGGPGNAIAINTGPDPGAGSITFVNGSRLLLRIRVFPKRPTTITIGDGSAQNPQITAVFQTADLNAVHFIEIDWTMATPTFTLGTDIGFDLLVDTIVYAAPA